MFPPYRANATEIRNTINDGKFKTSPSSPRQFFQRIYGHLEPSPIDNGDDMCKKDSPSVNSENSFRSNISTNNICESAYQSDGGSLSSPDISISDERYPPDAFGQHDFIIPNSNSNCNDIKTMPTMTGLSSYGISNAGFPLGLTAFLARRRRKEGRQRRQRTTFSTEQTLRLEVEFHRNEYISRSKRFELAETLRLSETQIKIWFQNRRAKDKRIEKAHIDNHYRNFVVANGFMNTIMGQATPYTPPAILTNIHQNFYHHSHSNEIVAQQNSNYHHLNSVATDKTAQSLVVTPIISIDTQSSQLPNINNRSSLANYAGEVISSSTGAAGILDPACGNLNPVINSY